MKPFPFPHEGSDPPSLHREPSSGHICPCRPHTGHSQSFPGGAEQKSPSPAGRREPAPASSSTIVFRARTAGRRGEPAPRERKMKTNALKKQTPEETEQIK